MASTMQIAKFISEIGPCAQKAYKILGKVKPSVCIAMACVESGYGTAGSTKYHSYLGHKVGSGKTATRYWSGKFFTSKTKEEYQIGVHTTIQSAFRAFDNMEQCVLNFYELMNTSLYSKVKAESPYNEQMAQIKQCGYMTSSTEVNSVLTIIAKYNLIKYDCETAPIGYIALKTGCRGEEVAKLQKLLNKYLGCHLVVDGIFGKQTEIKVVEYQATKGLKKDGIVGEQTRKSLGM